MQSRSNKCAQESKLSACFREDITMALLVLTVECADTNNFRVEETRCSRRSCKSQWIKLHSVLCGYGEALLVAFFFTAYFSHG